MSALKGDNVVDPRATRCRGTHGPPLLDHLETVHIASDRNLTDLRFPVQYVIRPNLDFRGFAGTVASGIIRKGDEVMVLPSGKRSRVKSIVTYDGELEEAFAPQAVTVTLTDEMDVSRGDMLVQPGQPAARQQPDRGDGGVDGRAAARARPDVHAEAHHAAGDGGGRVVPLRRRRQHPGAPGHRAAGAERGRARAAQPDAAAGVRPVPHQRRDRGVHPHRPADEQHGRRRDDPGGRQRPGDGRRVGGGAGGAPRSCARA